MTEGDGLNGDIRLGGGGQVPVSTHSVTVSAGAGAPVAERYSWTIARASSRSRLP
ncbi:hypothetical protein [Prescottella equi]